MAAGDMDLNERELESVDGYIRGDGSDGDSQRSVAQKASRGKRRRVAQLDPPQPKDDRLREVISSRMTARPNWQRQGGFAGLMQEITPGMNASDVPTVDELLLVSEEAVELLFGTGQAAFLQVSSPLSTTNHVHSGRRARAEGARGIPAR